MQHCIVRFRPEQPQLDCRRRKATHAAFVERMLPQLKEEKPGLKLSQYQASTHLPVAQSPAEQGAGASWGASPPCHFFAEQAVGCRT